MNCSIKRLLKTIQGGFAELQWAGNALYNLPKLLLLLLWDLNNQEGLLDKFDDLIFALNTHSCSSTFVLQEPRARGAGGAGDLTARGSLGTDWEDFIHCRIDYATDEWKRVFN